MAWSLSHRSRRWAAALTHNSSSELAPSWTRANARAADNWASVGFRPNGTIESRLVIRMPSTSVSTVRVTLSFFLGSGLRFSAKCGSETEAPPSATPTGS